MSKNIIFYFTGTGNSLKVARDIAKELGDCEIKLITNFKERVLEKATKVLALYFLYILVIYRIVL